MSDLTRSLPASRWDNVILPPDDGFDRHWHFHPSTPTLRTRLLRQIAARRAVPFPNWRVIKPVIKADRWNCLFLFCPSGRLDPVQVKLLCEARTLRGRLLVVVAMPLGKAVPDDLAIADALVEKELQGFDFSAYRIALALIAQHAPGALAYLQNDSVFGPIIALDTLVESAPWDLTGFIANPVVENHISSFAFVLRSVTPLIIAKLNSALPSDRCYDHFTDVVAMQETRLARVAARNMTVGSYWYVTDAPPEPSLAGAAWRRMVPRSRSFPLDLRGDPMLGMPLKLDQQGFPFVKRSLFGKFGGSHDEDELAAMLRRKGWPIAQTS